MLGYRAYSVIVAFHESCFCSVLFYCTDACLSRILMLGYRAYSDIAAFHESCFYSVLFCCTDACPPNSCILSNDHLRAQELF